MRSFSSRVIDAPGLCSPSRKVVSKMYKRSFMAGSMGVGPRSTRPTHYKGLPRKAAARGTAGGGGLVCARGAQQQAAEQDARQAEEIGRMRLVRHGPNSNYFSPPCKGAAAFLWWAIRHSASP